MIALVILLLLGTYPVCRAITSARRAGYLGFWAFAVWALLLISREAEVSAEGIREAQRKRQAHRAEWDRARGFREVQS
jgi:hypothetical protein